MSLNRLQALFEPSRPNPIRGNYNVEHTCEYMGRVFKSSYDEDYVQSWIDTRNFELLRNKGTLGGRVFLDNVGVV